MYKYIILTMCLYINNTDTNHVPNKSFEPMKYQDYYRTQLFGNRPRSAFISMSSRDLESPPIYKPLSQTLVGKDKSLAHFRPYTRRGDDEVNCLMCTEEPHPECRNMPSCVYCEWTAVSTCENDIPCRRCTVIKNPHFICTPGEKYMDDCNSCRCTDGINGWCTNMFCDFSAKHIFAMRLSDNEIY